MDPTGHTSVGVDKVLNLLYKSVFNRMKKSAMGIAADMLENASHGNSDSFGSLTLRNAAAGIVIAVSFSERMAIAVSVAGVAGATSSNMQAAGDRRAEENRERAERAA